MVTIESPLVSVTAPGLREVADRKRIGAFMTALAFMGLASVALPIAPAVAQLATVIDGAPAPVAPAVITRDAAQRATVRAIKLSEPLTLDGLLDEAVYTLEAPFGGLIQVAPDAGAPATATSVAAVAR